jgi:phosphoribosylanthranilate isomerase
MSVQVKICGITRREDALLAEELGAFAVGFVFYPKSPRYIGPEAAGAISRCLGESIARIGVFVDEEPGRVRETAAAALLTAVQLSGSERPEYLERLQGIPVVKAFRVGEEFDPRMLGLYRAEWFLLDTAVKGSYGGTGMTFPWEKALPCRNAGKIIVAGGLDAGNVADAVRTAKPWGVDVSGGVESAPGRKDRGKMTDFFRSIQETRL